MPRILGVDIPNDKPTHVSLRYIYGIGASSALRLCEQAHVNPQRRAKELSDDDISRLASIWSATWLARTGAARRRRRERRRV